MSLITCPECGKEISDKAVSCPNCGLVLKKYLREQKHKENQRKKHRKELRTIVPQKIAMPVGMVFIAVIVLVVIYRVFFYVPFGFSREYYTAAIKYVKEANRFLETGNDIDFDEEEYKFLIGSVGEDRLKDKDNVVRELILDAENYRIGYMAKSNQIKDFYNSLELVNKALGDKIELNNPSIPDVASEEMYTERLYWQLDDYIKEKCKTPSKIIVEEAKVYNVNMGKLHDAKCAILLMKNVFKDGDRRYVMFELDDPRGHICSVSYEDSKKTWDTIGDSKKADEDNGGWTLIAAQVFQNHDGEYMLDLNCKEIEDTIHSY